MGWRSRSRSRSHGRRHGKTHHYSHKRSRSRSRSRSHRRRSHSGSRSRSNGHATGARRRRSRSRSRSHSPKRGHRDAARSPTKMPEGRKGDPGEAKLAMQKVKERMREQLTATACADKMNKNWEGLSTAAAGFAAEEQAMQDFKPSVLMKQARIIEAVRSEEVEELAAADPARANPKAAADDRHWSAIFSSTQEQAAQSEDNRSDAGSIDSDALFDPRLLKEDEYREVRWRAFVQQIHEQKLLLEIDAPPLEDG
eukprot:GGOE01018625.1.p1 GENE.GGOE01018625.1~~GGOE01018625.1.p1  ORF type:complete len:254 (+),score=35.52 GGOE01018625.1:61-822(+)